MYEMDKYNKWHTIKVILEDMNVTCKDILQVFTFAI